MDKPLVWLHGEVKTPPFSVVARIETGLLLRRLLPSTEAAPILAAISIARNSADFWDANLDAWDQLVCAPPDCGTNPARIQMGNRGKMIVAGDVAAAVSIGVLISPILVVPFIGWGWYAAGVVGGGLIASGGAAIITRNMSTVSSSEFYTPRFPE